MTPSEVAANAAELRQFTTNHEARLLDAIEAAGGNLSRAAAAIGCDRTSAQTALRNLAKRAAVRGWSPDHDMTKTVPEPFVVRGTSTYYDRDGNVRGQWVKSKLDDQKREEMMRAAAEAMAEVLPRQPALPAPKDTTPELCNLLTLTDAHLGMLAWGAEGGADWDLGIAERTIVGAFGLMLKGSPAAASCVVSQLGDFLHWDGLIPTTPTSGHVLDADSRFHKVVRSAIRVLRQVVDMALTKHRKVYLLIGEGNHDTSSSVWMQELFRALYEAEPRIDVIVSPLPYYVHQHGKTMLGFHHGHLKKADSLPLLMAAQFPAVWGATAKRYVHVGHLHHFEIKEHPGVQVIRHPTLAARDAYAARHGFLSERQATVYTYHSEWGVVGSNTVTPEMLTQ